MKDCLDRSCGGRVKNRVDTFLCILLALCFLFLSCCSMPRIIVLDDPLTPEEHINLGIAYERKGETAKAVEEYEEASKRLPLGYLYLGNLYFQKGEFDHAEHYYKKTIEKNPDLADAYNNLAWLYYTKGENLGEAEVLAMKALALNPSKEIYHDTLSKIKESEGKKL
ncbi:MAG: tetratricopeptide repeat protein [Dissulfurispiraceae bacterium]